MIGDLLIKKLESNGAYARRDLMPIARFVVDEFWPDLVLAELTPAARRAMRDPERWRVARDRTARAAMEGKAPFAPLQGLFVFVAWSALVPLPVLGRATGLDEVALGALFDDVALSAADHDRLSVRLTGIVRQAGHWQRIRGRV